MTAWASRSARGQGKMGCPVPGCEGQKDVSLAVIARGREDGKGGYPKQRAQRSQGFCETHAIEVYDRLVNQLTEVGT